MTCQSNSCGQLQGNPPSVDLKNILDKCGCCVFAGSEDVQWASYIGQQPEQPDCVVTLYDSGGVRENTISECVYERFLVAVRVRGTDYLETYEKSQEVAKNMNLVNLLIIQNEVTFHTTYQIIIQDTIPEIEFYDEQNRPVFLLSFSGMRELVLEP